VVDGIRSFQTIRVSQPETGQGVRRFGSTGARLESRTREPLQGQLGQSKDPFCLSWLRNFANSEARQPAGSAKLVYIFTSACVKSLANACTRKTDGTTTLLLGCIAEGSQEMSFVRRVREMSYPPGDAAVLFSSTPYIFCIHTPALRPASSYVFLSLARYST
jgi:hypothetical protein